MQKTKYFTCVITQSYFSVPKDVRLNLTHYLIVKINNRKKIWHIAINPSADIDYKDSVKIDIERTKKPYSFLTIDTTLPASDPLSLGKICSNLIKMAVADQIMQNEAWYDLERKAAKISALSSNNLDKYEYFTDEDLD